MVYDVVIIGGGPGGYSCAIRASQLGLKTIVIEKENMGGVCANVGCIPTKSLANSAELARKIKTANSSGIKIGHVEFDFLAAVKKARTAASIVSQGVKLLLKNDGIEMVHGEAIIETPTIVKVGEQKFETKNIVIATGGLPFNLPGVEFGGKIISGEELVHLETVPKSVVIIGGGVEGVEYAAILSSFGIDVIVIEMFERLISLVDKEASEVVTKSLVGLGVKVLTGTKVEKIEEGIVFAAGQRYDADLVIVAIGKRANIGEDVKKLGLVTTKKGIGIDSHLRTNISNIYAVGDVVGGGLAHVASEQGIIAAENIAGLNSEYGGMVPSCIFTAPEIAMVGDTSGIDANVGTFPFAALGRATASGERTGFVKVFIKDEIVIGTVIAGPHASDLIAEAALAVKLKASVEIISKTIHAHPTFPEAFQEAVRAADGSAIHLVKK
ncbi:MAG: dihydrolipoyl dehydrogenase [Candidatus Micrarchaeota archaeon]